MPDLRIVELVLIGSLTGVVGGMLGIGGSLVMIPAMTEILGPDQHLYQAVAMIVNLFVAIPAVWQHWRAKAVDVATAARLVPLALVGVITGVAASEAHVFSGAHEAHLRGLFGLFLLVVCVAELWLAARHRRIPVGTAMAPPPKRTWGRIAIVSISVGFTAGLLGLGGGVLAVPLQMRVLRTPLRVAIANSAALILAMSLVGAATKNYCYAMDHDGSMVAFALAAILIPTAVAGSLLGAHLTHRLPLRVVRVLFFVLLAITALRLTYGAWRSIERTRGAQGSQAGMQKMPRDFGDARSA